MPEGVIRIAIGSEPDQRIPALVLEHTIRVRASRPVEILWSWDPYTEAWAPEASRYERLGGTNFSAWRWIAPSVARALSDPPEVLIYLDCDQVVLADIAELADSLPEDKAFGLVVGAEGDFNGKAADPHARETSVMVMRLAAADWSFEDLALLVAGGHMLQYARQVNPNARTAKSDYAALMQGTWLPDHYIHELAKGWNHLNHHDESSRLVHFTHVRSQPWKAPGHKLAGLWAEHLKEACHLGVVTWGMLEDEVDAGHIDAYWLGIGREAARAG